MKKQDLDFKLEQFKRLSTAFSLNEGKPVFVDGKHWTSHEFFSMLGQLKLESNELGLEIKNIERLFLKYKKHIPLN